MSFPVSYFTQAGTPVENAAGSEEAFRAAVESLGELVSEVGQLPGADYVAAVIRALHKTGFAVSRVEEPFPGQVARVRIDAYGESASEVEETLLKYAGRCDAATQASSCSYGECVIERNLEEEWGATYSWRGRLILHPMIGSIPSSERAVAAVAE